VPRRGARAASAWLTTLSHRKFRINSLSFWKGALTAAETIDTDRTERSDRGIILATFAPFITLAVRRKSKTDLVNPTFEQRHWEAFAVTGRNRLFLMAEQCPPHILRATGRTQPILRAMPQ
jgi:hypothetical protein